MVETRLTEIVNKKVDVVDLENIYNKDRQWWLERFKSDADVFIVVTKTVL